MMVLMIMLGPEIEKDEPSILNSNLLPVKANGEVLFLSVASLISAGSVVTPIFISALVEDDFAFPATIWSRMSASCSPRKIEIIAGGASLAPRRWSLPALAHEQRRSPAYVSTALMVAIRNVRN